MVALSPPSTATHTRNRPTLTLIKILDLLTNRYHVGVIRAALADGGLEIELPTSARLRAGQRIHFAIDNASGIIPRQAMRAGTVRASQASDAAHVRISLSTAAESLAA